MLEINKDDTGVLFLSGRLDASQQGTAQEAMDLLTETTEVDFSGLEYISSAGLRVLLETQQRLAETGGELILKNMNRHVGMVFDISGLHIVFKIQ